MMRINVIQKILIAGLCLLPSVGAQAHEATLTAVQGRVRIRHLHKSDYTKAKKGDGLVLGESIATGPKSMAHLDLRDRGALLIQENSVLKLEGAPDRMRLNFSFGEFLVGLKKKLAKNQSFEAITPAAAAVVRGTLFWGKTDLDQTATFAGFSNTIQVTAQGKTVTVAPGESVTIRNGEAPAEPKPSGIPLSYLKSFAIDGGIEGLDSLVDKKLRQSPAK